MTLVVAVGKTYRDGHGQDVTILVDHESMNHITITPFRYRFIGNKGKSYSCDGICRAKDKRFNLLFEVPL